MPRAAASAFSLGRGRLERCAGGAGAARALNAGTIYGPAGVIWGDGRFRRVRRRQPRATAEDGLPDHVGCRRGRGSRAGVPVQGRPAVAARARDGAATGVRPADSRQPGARRGRARRRGELDGPPAVADGPARDLLVGFETRAELLDALARLTPRQRAGLLLRYFNDLTEAPPAPARRW